MFVSRRIPALFGPSADVVPAGLSANVAASELSDVTVPFCPALGVGEIVVPLEEVIGIVG